MSKQILSTVAFMLLSLFVFAQRNNPLSTTSGVSGDVYKNEAKNFGLSIIKAYFNSDCNFVYSKMPNNLKSFDGGDLITKKQFTAQDICNDISIQPNATYSMYLDSYDPEVLNSSEFAVKYPAYQNVLNLQSGDYFFGANVLKSGKTALFGSNNHLNLVLKRLGTNNYQIIVF